MFTDCSVRPLMSNPIDVHIASFFAFHRPISVNSSIPISQTEKEFSQIFSRSRQKPHPGTVLFTLSSAVKSLENATQKAEQHQQQKQAQQQQSQLQSTPTEQSLWAAVTQASQSNAEPMPQEIPSAVYVNLKELAQNFRPFKPPPPPVPMEDMGEGNVAQSLQVVPAQHVDLPAAVVNEIAEEVSEAPGASPHHPFLNRLYHKYLRREEYLKERRWEIYHAISVKRQRRLKMKKHKYKKLMRRTRNLRQRQNRL